MLAHFACILLFFFTKNIYISSSFCLHCLEESIFQTLEIHNLMTSGNYGSIYSMRNLSNYVMVYMDVCLLKYIYENEEHNNKTSI